MIVNALILWFSLKSQGICWFSIQITHYRTTCECRKTMLLRKLWHFDWASSNILICIEIPGCLLVYDPNYPLLNNCESRKSTVLVCKQTVLKCLSFSICTNCECRKTMQLRKLWHFNKENSSKLQGICWFSTQISLFHTIVKVVKQCIRESYNVLIEKALILWFSQLWKSRNNALDKAVTFWLRKL